MLLKIKSQDLYRYFFYLFIFFLPFQTRKVFLTPQSFYTGDFTEYGTIFLYLSDIILFLAFVSLYIFNKNLIKNRLIELKSKNGESRSKSIIAFLFGFVFWALISSFLNRQYFVLSLFKFFKIFEMFLLALFIYITSSKERFLITSLFIVPLSGFFQSFLAIYQFLYQKSAFTSPLLHKLTGETIISPALPGIAKIAFDGEKIIRAYGTFPHPNILGGFLVFSIFITVYLYYEHKNDYLSSKYCLKHTDFQRHIISSFWSILFLSQFLALFLSFSRSAWLGLLIGAFIFVFIYFKHIQIVSRETINIAYIIKYLEIYKELFFSLLLILMLVVSNTNLILSRALQDVASAQRLGKTIIPHNEAFNDRIFFDNVSRETLSHNLILGSGPGTSVFQINNYLGKIAPNAVLDSWQYQPAHNIYLLCASETGIVGFFLLFYAILKILIYQTKAIVSRETIYKRKILKLYVFSSLIAFLTISMLDHYLWTFQQGEMMFWLTLGIAIV